MTISISTETNARLYRDAIAIAEALTALRSKCQLFAERLYFIGIPTDPANGGNTTVPGFEDAEDLAKADVAAAIGLVLDTRDFVDAGKLQVCAQLLRNEPL